MKKFFSTCCVLCLLFVGACGGGAGEKFEIESLELTAQRPAFSGTIPDSAPNLSDVKKTVQPVSAIAEQPALAVRIRERNDFSFADGESRPAIVIAEVDDALNVTADGQALCSFEEFQRLIGERSTPCYAVKTPAAAAARWIFAGGSSLRSKCGMKPIRTEPRSF